MPRSHRRRSGPDPDDASFERLLAGFRRSEIRRNVEWNVQPISAVSARKIYRCPGCEGEIGAGVAHLVVWRADGILGDEADLLARRHWHTRCWQIS